MRPVKRIKGYTFNFALLFTICLIAVSVFFTLSCRKEKEKVTEDIARPVKLMTIESDQTEQQMSYPGTVRASQRVDLAFRVSGPLIELPIDEGQKVEKGQIIARILPRDFETELASRKARTLEASQQYQRYRDLYIKKQVSKADFDKYKAQYDIAKAREKEASDALDDTNLRAPFSGVIAKRYVENFEDVQAKQPIVSLQDISYIEILIDVPELLMAQLRKRGSRVAFAQFAAAPGEEYALELKEFSTQADPKTQTYQVTLSMPAPRNVNILPGMTATVVGRTLGDEEDNIGAVIPALAIFSDQGGIPHVWLVNENTMTVHARKVTTGELTGTDSILVIEGLNPGDMIATSGVNNLREGMKVKQLHQ
jgi:RND family efflux transporter MFP subunit